MKRGYKRMSKTNSYAVSEIFEMVNRAERETRRSKRVIVRGAKRGETFSIDASDIDIVEDLVYRLVQANERIEELEDIIETYDYEIENDIDDIKVYKVDEVLTKLANDINDTRKIFKTLECLDKTNIVVLN